MDTQRKLEILADASRYDLSCACGTTDDDHRRRGAGGTWLYPASLPGGGTSVILKTLLSNSCVNDCRYCPLRNDQDCRRCTLGPEEIAGVFMDYARQRKAFGLFLTSAVIRSPDYTMDRMTAAAEILRGKFGYRGYIHLKIIPGSSDAAIAKALSLASAVSLNVEAPKRSAFETLSKMKDFDRDIVSPMKLISRLTAKGNRYERVKQTTQFIVGASNESDSDIVRATFGLYRRLNLNRVYFSAYQRGLGDPSLPGERNRPANPGDVLTREHRLYQADFLIRKYKWDMEDILFEADGSLSLEVDPKQRWAQRHPEFFPVRLSSASRDALLRIPGIGPITAGRIIKTRRQAHIGSLKDIGLRGKRLEKASKYSVTE